MCLHEKQVSICWGFWPQNCVQILAAGLIQCCLPLRQDVVAQASGCAFIWYGSPRWVDFQKPEK
jgi:hypothetical protein